MAGIFKRTPNYILGRTTYLFTASVVQKKVTFKKKICTPEYQFRAGRNEILQTQNLFVVNSVYFPPSIQSGYVNFPLFWKRKNLSRHFNIMYRCHTNFLQAWKGLSSRNPGLGAPVLQIFFHGTVAVGILSSVNTHPWIYTARKMYSCISYSGRQLQAVCCSQTTYV